MFSRLLCAAVGIGVVAMSACGGSEGAAPEDPGNSSAQSDAAPAEALDTSVAATPTESVTDEAASIDTGWQSTTLVLTPGEFTILKHEWLTSQAFLIEADPVGDIDVVLVAALDSSGYDAYVGSLTDDEISNGDGSRAIRNLNCLASEFGPPFGEARTGEDIDVAEFNDVSVTVSGESVAPILLADFFTVGKSEGNVNVSPYTVDTDVYWLIGAAEGGELTVRTRAITPPSEVRRDPDETDVQAFFAPYESEINDWVAVLGEPDYERPPWCPW